MVSVETEDDDEKEGKKYKVHPKAIHECVNEWVSYGTTQSTKKRKGREWSGVAGTVCVVMHYNGRGIVKG